MTGEPDVQSLDIDTTDGARLRATLFLPTVPLGPVTVLASAVAVPQRYYRAFAIGLARSAGRQ